MNMTESYLTDLADPLWSTDLLIVGSGAGALTSAITAAEHGLDTLVIEKGHLWGGTSATSGGTLWIPCTRHMAACLLYTSPSPRDRG